MLIVIPDPIVWVVKQVVVAVVDLVDLPTGFEIVLKQLERGISGRLLPQLSGRAFEQDEAADPEIDREYPESDSKKRLVIDSCEDRRNETDVAEKE
ncbi:hypothetical protein [Corynebacterium flavescens]|uniref:hypothetical protein n=1 Tax=Corynebacterium flavescens TaxID=28028 RepID=UPI0011421D9E|nr:hypothetical protein [Corynebacterium flavescens]